MKQTAHIILADDDPDDCFIFSALSQEVSKDIRVTCLHDCTSLLHYLTDNPPPDMVFLDLNMPILSGWDCLKKIRENLQWNKIPVVIYSTASRQDMMELCYKLGANMYIVKPNDSAKLKEAISLAIKDLLVT
jgi:CheY-like chemotaxis protein